MLELIYITIYIYGRSSKIVCGMEKSEIVKDEVRVRKESIVPNARRATNRGKICRRIR